MSRAPSVSRYRSGSGGAERPTIRMSGARSQRLHPHLVLGVLAVVWVVLGRADDVLLARSLRFAIIVVVLADVVWAGVRGSRASVRVVDQAALTLVGDELGLVVEVRGAGAGILVTLVSWPGARRLLAEGDSVGPLPGRAAGRGVVTEVRVELRADGPLGLLGYGRTYALPVRPLYVGPRPIRPEVPVDLDAGITGEERAPDLGDALPSTLREYRPGDPWRRISWPVTARAGRLVTREYEREAAPRVRLVVDLGPHPSVAGERAAAVAAGLGGDVLRRGCTLEVHALAVHGPVVQTVDAAGLHRVLAAAQYGPAVAVDGRALVVGPEGVGWR